MIRKHLFFVAVYLRLSRDDEDIDGSTKAESNQTPLILIFQNTAKPFQKQICGGRKILVFFPYNG